jgi:hypothetical protein
MRLLVAKTMGSVANMMGFESWDGHKAIQELSGAHFGVLRCYAGR